eukprot:TRINITY_DN88468_c0_g1_i1.p1 TRINITY_DN88468_c0_g1~~TRINITY_DN88468_c0_g1_i1.p1  ORF type:complete len:351 (+),score=67.18 TRINITY_DN88468_c0_g1_i1:131-1183(+)
MALPSISRRGGVARVRRPMTIEPGSPAGSTSRAFRRHSTLPVSLSDSNLRRSPSIGGGRANGGRASVMLTKDTSDLLLASRRPSKESNDSRRGLDKDPVAAKIDVEKKLAERDPMEALGFRAMQLAKQHRLEFYEVKVLLEAVHNASKTPEGFIGVDEFTKILKRAFEVDTVPEDLVCKLHGECCKDRSGAPREFDVSTFLDWYMVNIFTTVAHLRGDQKAMAGHALTEELCNKHGLQKTQLDKIKKQFDKYDLDGSGNIDQDEFYEMISAFVGAGKGDISGERLKAWWREIDLDCSGEVDFGEFVEWYLKYFNGGGDMDPTKSFYESFCPSKQRQALIMNAEALLMMAD